MQRNLRGRTGATVITDPDVLTRAWPSFVAVDLRGGEAQPEVIERLKAATEADRLLIVLGKVRIGERFL